MVCAPVRSIIPSLKLGDYLSVQAHKPCSISQKDHTVNKEVHMKIQATIIEHVELMIMVITGLGWLSLDDLIAHSKNRRTRRGRQNIRKDRDGFARASRIV